MSRSIKKSTFSNPFYVLLLVVSLAFTATCFAYLAGPNAYRRAQRDPASAGNSRSLALASWLNDWGPTVLAVQLAIMIGSGTLAMVTDHWFSKGSARARPTPERSGADALS
jgi:hypothetical protein